MIILSQAPEDLRDLSTDDTSLLTTSALQEGFCVYHIPREFEVEGDVEEYLHHVPTMERDTPAMWIGVISSMEYYEAMYRAMAKRRIFLLNDPSEHQLIFEFDRAYPYLEGLTPQSVIIESEEGCIKAAELLGFPVFVKGALLSRKGMGWKACVAADLASLQELTRHLLASKHHSRGRVIVRQLAHLRHRHVEAMDFPIGREYRVFLYRAEIVAFGFYWPYIHLFDALTEAEEAQMLALAREAARRLPTPYISLDIGQLEEGGWIVIETGDPQFSGTSFIHLSEMWHRLRSLLA